MKLTRPCILGCLILLAITPLAPAQFVPVQADGAGGLFSLTPMLGAGDPSAPLFSNAPNPPTGTAGGTIGGRGASAGLGSLEIGFDYLRPYWTSRDFTLAVPAVVAGSFPLLGNIGNVDNQFALAPRVNYKYDVSNDFAIKASGTFMTLNGTINQNLTANDGSVGLLTATSQLTIISANLPEITTRFAYADSFAGSAHYWPCFDALTVDLGIGTRYSSLSQTYTGDLSNTSTTGKNETSRSSTQSFAGIGLTSSLDFNLPFREKGNGEMWNLFTNLRGSILVGDNKKNSSLSVNLAGMPGIPASISQSKTEYMPVAEVESGVEWTHFFGDVNNPDIPPALFTVRVGVSGQFWGDAGPLSAGSPQGFRTSNLFLVGAHVMVGIAH
jgi:Legionella pneumophila major outer membrane protein precursor